MSTIGNTYFDLIDLYKSKDPDGNIADVIEMLMELNPMMADAYAVECNNGTSHRHTIRTGLPSVAWGKLYAGISQSKSTKAQVDDTTGFVEGLSSIDCRLLELAGGNKGAIRLSEAQAYLESIAQEMQETIIYGNSATAPSEFMGLAPRFNDTSAANGNQVVLATDGADNANCSIWFVTWGDNACQTLYPKGTQGGVKREDMGKQRVTDGSGNPYYVEEEMFTQHCGLAVKDWRYVSRIANIKSADFTVGGTIYDLMRQAYYKLQSRRVPHGKQCIYMNTDCLEALDRMATNAGGGSTDNFVRLTRENVEGKEIISYRGIPIRETDALHNQEGAIS